VPLTDTASMVRRFLTGCAIVTRMIWFAGGGGE
jgi:hypothetical protein